MTERELKMMIRLALEVLISRDLDLPEFRKPQTEESDLDEVLSRNSFRHKAMPFAPNEDD